MVQQQQAAWFRNNAVNRLIPEYLQALLFDSDMWYSAFATNANMGLISDIIIIIHHRPPVGKAGDI